ncbi:MAG: ribosome-binding factor A [Planctomycetota bacterium]
MGLSKKERELLLKKYCGVINADDAIDPRHYFYNKRKQKKQYRKVFQLCRQVADTLHMVINEGDPLLEGLSVVEVLPAPDSHRLLVIVSLDPAVQVESASDIEQIMNCLQAHQPRLRAEIARSINRRKTPTLTFEMARLA